MPAAGLADVVAGYPQPPVLLRRHQHLLEQLAVRRLEVGAGRELATSFGDLVGERVADRLELSQAEGPRLAGDGGHAGVDSKAGKGLGDDRRQLPLQAADLAPQLGAGQKLVPAGKRLSPAVSIKQIRHNPNRV